MSNDGGRKPTTFPLWGSLAIPAGILWGTLLGVIAGMLLGNVVIGAAIGAGLGIGIGLTLFAAAVVIASGDT
jgi:predicted ABC-type sugar transport system permease subunit